MSLMKDCLLKDLEGYRRITEALASGTGPVQASGCTAGVRPYLAACCAESVLAGSGWLLYVAENETRAREVVGDLRTWCPGACYYPPKDFLFYSADLQGAAIEQERFRAYKAMATEKGGVIVTTVDALMNRIPPASALLGQSLILEEGGQLEPEDLRKDLVKLGYRYSVQTEQPGQFAVRGGIVDIFPLTEDVPWRIEFWGDEIDSIRTFDPESQRSIERVPVAEIFPASELILTPSDRKSIRAKLERELKKNETALRTALKTEAAFRLKTAVNALCEALENGLDESLESLLPYRYPDAGSLLEYFAGDRFLLVLDDPIRLKDRADAVEAEFRESMSHRLEGGYLLPGQANVSVGADRVFAQCRTGRTLAFTSLDSRIPQLPCPVSAEFFTRAADSYRTSFETLIKDLTGWQKKGWRVVMVTPSRTRAEHMAGRLREYDLAVDVVPEGETADPASGMITVVRGSLSRGFACAPARSVLLTESELFGQEVSRRKKRRRHTGGTRITGYGDLSVGDYVVHEVHGIGIYRGIEKVELDHLVRDYMKIEYADGGNLYIPATQFDVIAKYADAGAEHARVNRLGSPEWKRTRTRVRHAVEEIAEDLVKLYAARQNGTGYRYGPDTVWQREFEELFPFEETDDQRSAIEAVKADMESSRIMDRLLCGDVGFGKTEVALRAAFKAVQENKQVVYLVPTTILARQHFNTFTERMKNYPVRIEMLSRFRTAAETREVLKDLKRGLVDIVIGTHRVLSDDVVFKDLGLLLIDEEQRFGVKHKEKIKQMKNTVDVLTLTATPIPRTLHMSLVGIRDMSLLQEPPADRLPIQTYVMEWNPEIVREAIHRELARGGQVYCVHNRVQDITEMTAQIAALAPDAVVRFAHGQMSERELEAVMTEFVEGRVDVLVSTTIIETGLDISNVNTIIINNADRYGLSQLYQLRGRVGRASRTSYAFILYRKDKILKEEAEKRLAAIREFTELGSGMRIAMRDLQIRGAGNVLGASQHGHLEAVGYDLYCKMLGEAVQTAKGEAPPAPEYETAVDLPVDAFIPPSYIRSEGQKLDMYRRIAGVKTEEERMDMVDELTDRYGDLPAAVSNLLQIAVVRQLAHEACLTDLTVKGTRAECRLYKDAPVDPAAIPDLLARYRNRVRVRTGEDPAFLFTLPEMTSGKEAADFRPIKSLLFDIKNLLVS